MIQWLLSRIQKSEKSISQNKQYSTEVLAILLQSSTANITRLVELDGIDTLLQLLSPYRKRDPAKVSEEEEYVENLFDCIICCVDDREGKEKFLAAEGIELCLIMLREGKMSKPRALRLLDHALGGPDGAACCERLVEAVGLKTTFTMFMKKVLYMSTHGPKPAKIKTNEARSSTTLKRQNTFSGCSHPCYAPSPPPPTPESASLPSSSRRITKN